MENTAVTMICEQDIRGRHGPIGESIEGPQSWLSRSLWHRRMAWDSWACSAWRKQGLSMCTWWWVLKTGSFQGCLGTGPERLWNICPWRWIVWTLSWANSCGWLCCGQETGVDKPQRCWPALDLLWSCDLSSLSTSHFLPSVITWWSWPFYPFFLISLHNYMQYID